ncbi:transposable element Tc1 transposase [Trichonephila clavipes]|uniref:Transposable element Tc1 transposase n=1 Tax=Trichonephila clavipes TaxID=2585209 RepID=A0A8X7BL27_TRICX|nr:transposable element Tc1 transposase [Trichonephila clavipes]
MINGRTRLHVVANGTMTGQRYIDEVLLSHVRLFRGAVCDKFVFMDDNATYHRTLAVQDCLDSEGIQRLVWPARSPDLNPIENVWDALGRQVAGRNYPPTNKNTLIRALTEEWDNLPQQLLDNVVQKSFSPSRNTPETQFLRPKAPATVHLIDGRPELSGKVTVISQIGYKIRIAHFEIHQGPSIRAPRLLNPGVIQVPPCKGLKSVEDQNAHVGMLWKLGTQVSSLLLERDSKLRGSSPIGFELFKV